MYKNGELFHHPLAKTLLVMGTKSRTQCQYISVHTIHYHSIDLTWYSGYMSYLSGYQPKERMCMYSTVKS